MRTIAFTPEAFGDFAEIMQYDKQLARKLITMIKEIVRSPFEGTGKPEALRYELSGYWSRRLDIKNRIIYKVTDTEIYIISCKDHY